MNNHIRLFHEYILTILSSTAEDILAIINFFFKLEFGKI